MKLFSWGKDGGQDSNVWGFWLIELKSLFSVAILKFEPGTREAFHSHAFNSVSWLIKGNLEENFLEGYSRAYLPSPVPIYTFRDDFHQVWSNGTSWVLTFRGPWAKTWEEYLPKEDRFITLTNGRRVVESSNN